MRTQVTVWAALTHQIKRLERHITRMKQFDTRLSNLRLAAVILGVPVITILILATLPAIAVVGALLIIGGFLALVVAHLRFRDRLRLWETWLRITIDHVERSLADTESLPSPNLVPPVGHPFADDLDVANLHRLLDTASTRQGSERLFGWLTTTSADLETIKHRQSLVKELLPRTLMRTRLEVLGQLGKDRLQHFLDGKRLAEWVQEPVPPHLPTVTIILLVLSAVNLTLFMAFTLTGLTQLLPIVLIPWALYGVLFISQYRQIGSLFRETTTLLDLLETAGQVMLYLEDYPFRPDSGLAALCRPITGQRPSRLIRRLSWIASGASLQGNLLLWLFVNAVVPWDLVVAVLLNRQKALAAQSLPEWLDTWYTLEALCSLATYASLHPDVTFPEIREDGPVIDAHAIGHPLLRYVGKVRNNFTVHQPGEIRLITGSNMSGKSTFLRTVGINLCMAFAGAPVDASALAVRPLRLFTCIQIADSLQDGISYFYAEVKRLKALLDALTRPDERPLVYLIDEIFRGTNNRERLIGSRAYIQSAVGQNGVGLVATHDLEMTQLANAHPAIHNMHFTDSVVDGQMVFDYILRPGASPTTNALTIMQMEGLPTGEESA